MSPYLYETVIQDILSALLEPNQATLELLFSPSVSCHLGGQTYTGFETVLKLWLEFRQSQVGLELKLESCLVNDHGAAALCRYSLSRHENGKSGKVLCWLYFKAGQLTECTFYQQV
ncbi:MAG: hypothetical protein KC422_11355 [Trueperaceae bacterium]|nr:hypothetical protein [Trueperaceae bacterium]